MRTSRLVVFEFVVLLVSAHLSQKYCWWVIQFLSVVLLHLHYCSQLFRQYTNFNYCE